VTTAEGSDKGVADNPLPGQPDIARATRGMRIAIAGYAVLFSLQIAAFLLTNVLVLLAGAFDTATDICISAFLLLALYWSRRPADAAHLFGHARAQNVAALVAAVIFIASVSVEMFRAAIPRLFSPETVDTQYIPVGIAVTVIALAITAVPLADIYRTGYRESAVKAQLVALVEMVVAYSASLAALILVDRGYLIADPVASIIVATFIAISGIYLIRENVPYLVGKSPSPEFLELISRTAGSVGGVLGVHDLTAEYAGPDILQISLHIEVARGTPIEEADRIAELVKAQVTRESGCGFCLITVDPWCPHEVCFPGEATGA
jgi:cation diffusion facilitator family transporter